MGKQKLLIGLLLLVLLASLVATQVYGDSPGDPLMAKLLADSGGGQLAFHNRTGLLRFYSVGPEIRAQATSASAQSLSAQAVAEAFLAIYGRLFGLANASQELALRSVQYRERGRAFVRYQQVYQGVPVLGGELSLQVAGGAVLSANGEIAPVGPASVSPTIAAVRAQELALVAAGKGYRLSASQLQASTPELWLYCPALLGPGPLLTRLVWRLEVTSPELPSLRELVLVDAHLGAIALRFNQIDTALDRTVYDNNEDRSAGLPGYSPVRVEGQGITGITDADLAYDYAGYVYNFYFTRHGRDSLDGAGMAIVNTVRYCPPWGQGPCPYDNAFWNGEQMVYGGGMVADDVVGHEMTHAVTQYESRLFYAYQSGAINESLSDIWGEFIDQVYSNGSNPGLRWLIGEDLPPSIGVIRDMAHPHNYSQPERMGDDLYYACTDAADINGDMGGVHTNSGVLNKAAYLITDGGSFNGQTIAGIGLEKAARIFYELQTNLLTSASDYHDVYNLLPQACNNLIGSNGITAADCAEVQKAVQATEMDQDPTGCPAPEAPVCPAGQYCTDLFYDNLENPASGYWQKDAGSNWYYPQNSHSYADWDATYATSGQYNLWGYDQETRGDYAISMTTDVALPAGKTVYMHFRHSYDFEASGGWLGYFYFDGGVLEYSLDGGSTWADAGSLADYNGYGGTIDAAGFSDNPLQGRSAFVGRSNGYISTRLELTSLAGNNVRFRFRIGTDSGTENYGWFIDDIRIYTADTSVPTATASTTPPAGTPVPSPTPTATPTPLGSYLPVAFRNWAPQREPNDAYYSSQWNLKAVRAPVAWGRTTGANGPIIAILDTGVSLAHPDLQANLLPGWDFVNGDSSPDDDNGHGTHVAGIAAAVGNNGFGVSGVAWQGRILPVKILDQDGVGDSLTLSNAIHWAVDSGARVLSLSLGSPYSSWLMEEAINYALSRGVLVVAAAGNVGGSSGVPMGTAMYPAAYPGVIAVGATDAGNQVTPFSNQGPFVDVVAPGAGILSTYLIGGGSYAQMSGTSMATPHVGGLAVLVWSVYPSLSGQDVGNIIMQTALDLGSPGWDAACGYGLMDAGQAVTRGPQMAVAVQPQSQGGLALGQSAWPPSPGSYRPGVVLVRLTQGADLRALAQALPGAVAAAQIMATDASGVVQVSVPAGQELQAVQSLAALPEVAGASLNYLVLAQ
ncbi:MAG: S8 family serine peptidase [Anaerolineae bacterium]